MEKDLETLLIETRDRLLNELRLNKIEKITGKRVGEINDKIEEDFKYYKNLVKELYNK